MLIIKSQAEFQLGLTKCIYEELNLYVDCSYYLAYNTIDFSIMIYDNKNLTLTQASTKLKKYLANKFELTKKHLDYYETNQVSTNNGIKKQTRRILSYKVSEEKLNEIESLLLINGY